MINTLPLLSRRSMQRQWVEQAAIFFINSVHGLTAGEYNNAIDRTLRAFDLGHSGARSVFFGYDYARRCANEQKRL